jgi:hypothetical protein
MARSELKVCIVIFGVVAGCQGSPVAPTGVELFAAGRVSMTFTAQDETPAFATAAEVYRRLWVDEGARIVETMERVTGLRFQETNVKAVIFEGPSRSGVGDTPMYLRASYTEDVKKATLVHENGHRLIAQLRNRPGDLDEHRVLFLFLYDVLESLWGKDFADAQVRFESGLTGLYDYDSAWKWALSIGKAERASRFAAIVNTNRR